MADDASHEASSSTVRPAADDPESTIEINIKTLDSQVHKLRVEKNVRILRPLSLCARPRLFTAELVWSPRDSIQVPVD